MRNSLLKCLFAAIMESRRLIHMVDDFFWSVSDKYKKRFKNPLK